MIPVLKLQAVVLINVSLSNDCDDMTFLPPEDKVQGNECYRCKRKCPQSTGKYLRFISGILTDVVNGYSHISLSTTKATGKFQEHELYLVTRIFTRS